mmetsp:Transcript_11816/g.27544  ORF Transcript_11816/g.27544 Transcript_11816/m.27544 type:complete len:174 (-) Transcript_11816:307-828(-)
MEAPATPDNAKELVLSAFQQHEASKGGFRVDQIQALVISLASTAEPVSGEELARLTNELTAVAKGSSSGVLQAEDFVQWLFPGPDVEEDASVAAAEVCIGNAIQPRKQEAAAIQIQSAQRALVAKREVAVRRHVRALPADEEDVAGAVVGQCKIRVDAVQDKQKKRQGAAAVK